MSLNPPGLIQIGRTIVSDRFPITMDTFWFAINSNVIVNPFDFVTVKNLHNTRTIGIVKELQTVAIYENMVIQSGINGSSYEEQIEKRYQGQGRLLPSSTALTGDEEDPGLGPNHFPQSSSITVAKVAVMANTGVKIEETGNNISVSMPIAAGKTVEFATIFCMISSILKPKLLLLHFALLCLHLP